MSKIVSALPDKNFDINKFDREFVFKKEDAEISTQIKSQKKLDELASQANYKRPKKIYELSIIELFIGIKNTWFRILDGLLAKKFNKYMFIDDNGLFYIGLTIIMIAIFLYVFNEKGPM